MERNGAKDKLLTFLLKDLATFYSLYGVFVLHSENKFKHLNMKIRTKDISICMITEFLSQGVDNAFRHFLHLTTQESEDLRKEWRTKRLDIMTKYKTCKSLQVLEEQAAKCLTPHDEDEEDDNEYNTNNSGLKITEGSDGKAANTTTDNEPSLTQPTANFLNTTTHKFQKIKIVIICLTNLLQLTPYNTPLIAQKMNVRTYRRPLQDYLILSKS